MMRLIRCLIPLFFVSLLTSALAEEELVLNIFGNANMDLEIDQRDIDYVKGIIEGKNQPTELSDADRDGDVDDEDVDQIDEIISKTAKSISLTDYNGRVVEIEMPVKHFIPSDYRTTEAMLAIGAGDMIVGVDKAFHERMPEFGLADLPEVSMHGAEVNYEQMLVLEPDLVILPVWQAASADEITEKLPGVRVIVLGCTARREMIPELKAMGLILDKEDQVENLVNWINKYNNIVEERTKNLKPEEQPTFYYEYMSGDNKWWAITPTDPSAGEVAEGCGGRNIAADLADTSVEVEPEWVISTNPDFIFMDLMKGFTSGPGKTEEDMKSLRKTILDDRKNEGVSKIKAVQDGNVYLVDRDLITGPRWVIGHTYFAKWLHPELFEDLSPEEMHEEYLNEFHDLQLDGTWVYPSVNTGEAA